MSGASSWPPPAAVELGRAAGTWLVPIAAARRFARDLLPLLDETERARLATISHPARAEAYLLGHGLLRQALSCRTHGVVGAGEWRLQVGALGKPGFRARGTGEPFEISIAHCATAIALAIKEQAAVGVDVEEVEQGGACCKDNPSWNRALHAWTRREAIGKCDGSGLFRAGCIVDDPAMLVDSGNVTLVDVEYVVAVAILPR